MPLRNPSTSHAEAHTVASHSDTTGTGAELETLTDGSDASALHVHTVVSLDTTATGANLTTLTDASETALHSHAASGIATGVIWQGSNASDHQDDTDGNYSIAAQANNSDTDIHYSFVIPTGFTTLTKAVAVGISNAGTGNLAYSVNTSFAAAGEAKTANSDSISMTTAAVTANEMEEIDISAAFTGIAAGDYVGVDWNRDGADASDTIEAQWSSLGIRLEYT